MDPILAKPADLCCIKGAIHSGEPLGKIKQIGGVDTYVASPDPETANGNVILFFPDVFGLYINSLLMMDAYAACGYLTLGVDYFVGEAVGKYTKTPLSDLEFDFEAWKNRQSPASDKVGAKWVEDVRAEYGKDGNVKFACVGFCWGARFVCRALSSKTGICQAGAIAHPSFLNESHVLEVDAPIFFSVPSTDKLFLPEQRNRTVEILESGNKHFNMQVFSNVGHGFASRAFLTDPYERFAKEQSFKSFVAWFDHWLSVA